jgi:hypothetical protein
MSSNLVFLMLFFGRHAIYVDFLANKVVGC